MADTRNPQSPINARSAIERLLRSEAAASGDYCTVMRARGDTPVPRVGIVEEGGGLRELAFPLDGDGIRTVRAV